MKCIADFVERKNLSNFVNFTELSMSNLVRAQCNFCGIFRMRIRLPICSTDGRNAWITRSQMTTRSCFLD